MPASPNVPYELVTNAVQRQQLKIWAARAASLDRTTEYVAALKTMCHQLTTNPTVWGDPCFHLVHFNSQVYQRAFTPLYVCYAVNEERRIVFVTKFALLPRSGLEQDD